MSSGLISLTVLPKSYPVPPPSCALELLVELLTGTPSITNKAWLLPVRDVAPLIITFVDPPKLLLTFNETPAALPCKLLIKLSVLTWLIASPLTSCVA